MTQELSTPHLALHTVNLSQELTFLIACCQTDPSEEDIEFIHSHLNNPHLDTSALVGLAHQHGILPLVYKTIRNLSESNDLNAQRSMINAEILTELKAHYMSIAQRNMFMSSELIRIMKLLEENDIEALAFKGPTLSQMSYGDITLRQYGDLDILVNEKDAYKAGKLMSKNGHTCILPLDILSNKTCLHTAKDFSLMSQSGGVHTELHWQLFENKYNISILSCTVENKCQTVKINGKEIRTLQNELLLVYLCLHGAKHAFERIEWICDIDRLIRSVGINWEEAIAIADQSHAKCSFYLGLSLAHHLFHTALPSNILKSIDADETRTLQNMTFKQMAEKTKERSEFKKNRETFFYHAKLFDKKSDMLRFYLSTFFKISTSDCQTFALPEKLKFLYIFLRPVRLTWKYTQKLFKK